MPRNLCAAVLGFFTLFGITFGHKHPPNNPARKPPVRVSAASPKRDLPTADRFWAEAQKEVYKRPEVLAAQQASELAQGVRYDKLMRGDPRVPVIALTFDDGPHPKFTPKILAILKRYNIKATFFVVGEMAEKYPGLIKAEVRSGQLVANHTYHHVNLSKIAEPQIETEWQACQDVVRAITGQTMRYCRPPGGDYNRRVMKAAMDTGLVTVLWTDDPGDYASPGDSTIKLRTLDRVSNGGIILLHDGVQQTIDVLPQIIQTLQKKGFRFTTTSEMDRRVARRL